MGLGDLNGIYAEIDLSGNGLSYRIALYGMLLWGSFSVGTGCSSAAGPPVHVTSVPVWSVASKTDFGIHAKIRADLQPCCIEEMPYHQPF